jgi:RimJ/RimL family protein N-acetyltransferase
LDPRRARALTRIAFELHEVHRMEIHCDPANTRSSAVPKKLGYTHEATLRHRLLAADSEPRDTMIWTMTREEHAASSAVKIELEAIDAAGRRLI